MSESEFFICKQCGKEHEALTQETASYLCPNQPKVKGKLKMLDSVSKKLKTELLNSSETQVPQDNQKKMETQYDCGQEEEAEQTPCSNRDSRPSDSENDDRVTGRESE